MGQSFSTIAIICEAESKDEKLEQLIKILENDFIKEDTEVEFGTAMNNLQARSNERLIMIYSNKIIIKIEDLTEVIEPKKLQEISKKLSLEILRATNSDTAGISQILIYQNGEHIREKTLGEEWESLEEMQKYFPDATENDLRHPEVGKVLDYEINGSGAISVIEEFERGLIKFDEYNEIKATIYKYKER